MVCLDLDGRVIDEVISNGCDMVITHHPLIFHPLKAVTDETEVGRCIQLLCAKGISAINAHTNLDCAPEGVNFRLAQKLGLSGIEVIDPNGTDEQGNQWGLLRKGTVEEQPLERFLTTVKQQLGCDGLRYVSGGKPVRQVAVGGGACGSELMDALRAGCDTFVTADVKYNGFWDAKAVGINLIDAGHFQTENPVVPLLAEKIAAAFPEIQVIISETHNDCMKYY
jgi:dinuclear metal center YbgI/SA1388 family protein